MLVVPNTPSPVRNVASSLLLAEMEAVGVPDVVLSTANLALLVVVPPIKRSRVELIG